MAYAVQILNATQDVLYALDYSNCTRRNLVITTTSSGSVRVYSCSKHLGDSAYHHSLQECLEEMLGSVNVVGNSILPCIPGQCIGEKNGIIRASYSRGVVMLENLMRSKRRDRFVRLSGVYREGFWYGYSIGEKQNVFTVYICDSDGKYKEVSVTRRGVYESSDKFLRYRTMEDIMFNREVAG